MADRHPVQLPEDEPMHWGTDDRPVQLLKLSTMWMRPKVSLETMDRERQELEAEFDCRLKLHRISHPPARIRYGDEKYFWFFGWTRWSRWFSYYTLAQWQIVEPD
jgi:hypothetical protein